MTKEYPYLIALALVEQDGKRKLPLGGKSVKKGVFLDPQDYLEAKVIALELLLRVYQSSQDGIPLLAKGKESLLLIEIEMSKMQDTIPLIKQDWISTGDNYKLIESLKSNSYNIWSISYEKYNGIRFNSIQ